MPVTPEQARAELARRRAQREAQAPQRRFGPSRSAALQLADDMPRLEDTPEGRNAYLRMRAAQRRSMRAGPLDVTPLGDPLATERLRTDTGRGVQRGLRATGDWLRDRAENAYALEDGGINELGRRPRGARRMDDESFERLGGEIADEIVVEVPADERERRNAEYRAEQGRRRIGQVRQAQDAAGDALSGASNWMQEQMIARPGLTPSMAVSAAVGEGAYDMLLREPARAYERGAAAGDIARYEGREDDAADQALGNLGQSGLAALSAWPGSATLRAGGRMAARQLGRVGDVASEAGARVAPRVAPPLLAQGGEFRTMMGVDPTRRVPPRRMLAEEQSSLANRIQEEQSGPVRARRGGFAPRNTERDARIVALRDELWGTTRNRGGQIPRDNSRRVIVQRLNEEGYNVTDSVVAGVLKRHDDRLRAQRATPEATARTVASDEETAAQLGMSVERYRQLSARRTGGDDVLAWLASGGAWTTAGALAAGGEARAQDEQEQTPLETSRTRLREMEEELRQFRSSDVREQQRALQSRGLYGGPIDGVWGGATQRASEGYTQSAEEGIREERERSATLASQEEAARQARLTDPNVDLAIKAANLTAFFGGAFVGHGSRNRAVREADAVTDARNRSINERIPTGRVSMADTPAGAADRLGRVGPLNQVYQDGGARGRVPFNTASGQAEGFSAAPNPMSANDLFRPSFLSDRVRGDDVGAIAMSSGEAYLAHTQLEQHRTKLAELEAQAVNEPQNVALGREINNERIAVAAWELAMRGGAGFATGRAAGVISTPYSVQRPSRLGEAEAQVAALNRRLALPPRPPAAPRASRPRATPASAPPAPPNMGSVVAMQSMSRANVTRTLDALALDMSATGQRLPSYTVYGLTPARQRALAATAGRQGYVLRPIEGGVQLRRADGE